MKDQKTPKHDPATENDQEAGRESSIYALLATWVAKRSRLDAEYEKLKCLFDASPECSPVKAMFDLFSEYTDVLSRLLDDQEGWLEWYSWENENGAKKLKAKASNWNESRPIVTPYDLADLIANTSSVADARNAHVQIPPTKAEL